MLASQYVSIFMAFVIKSIEAVSINLFLTVVFINYLFGDLCCLSLFEPSLGSLYQTFSFLDENLS